MCRLFVCCAFMLHSPKIAPPVFIIWHVLFFFLLLKQHFSTWAISFKHCTSNSCWRSVILTPYFVRAASCHDALSQQCSSPTACNHESSWHTNNGPPKKDTYVLETTKTQCKHILLRVCLELKTFQEYAWPHWNQMAFSTKAPIDSEVCLSS